MAKLFTGGIFKFIAKLFGFGGNNWVFAVLSLIGMFTKKKKKPAEINNKNQDSPVYSWDGVTTTSDTDIPIPLIFGKHQVGGNIVNTFITSTLIEGTQNESIAITNVTSADDANNKTLTYKTPTINGATTKNVSFSVINTLVREYNSRGIMNNNGLPQINYDTVIISYKKENASTWKVLQTLTDNILQTTETINVQLPLDSTYSGAYLIKLQHEGTSTISYEGKTIIRTINSYNKIVVNSTAYKYTKYYVGTNASSAQTLYLDVALGIGQLENVVSIQVNDQYLSDYVSEYDIDKKSVRIAHEFKAGHDLLVPYNKNDFVKVQSSVFNKNAEIKRVCRTQLAENTTVGSSVVKIVRADSLFSDYGTRAIVKFSDGTIYTIQSITGDTVTLTTPMQKVYVAGDDIYAPDESAGSGYSITGEFTTFTYTTQGDYTDKLDIGLNAPNGMYSVDNDGNYQKATVNYEIWATHSTTDIANIESDNFYHEVATIIGARAGRIWYNKILDTLPINPLNNKKQYKIRIKKLTRDAYENTLKNDLQIAYIEEIKNKDIYYNNVGYVSLIMPADSKLNGSTPTFKFEVEGLLVPCMLPKSIVVNQDDSTTTVINLKNNNIVNYKDANNNEYAIGALVASMDRVVDLDNWLSILTNANFSQSKLSGTRFYKGKNIVTGYFKCGDEWHKRYCVLKTNVYQDGYAGNNPLNYNSKIMILTQYTITALINEYTGINDDLVEVFSDLPNIYVEKELPSVPTDVILYKWSDNPAECVLYAITNEDNGLAIPFDKIDLATFIEARDYYNETIPDPLNNGKYIKRSQLNIVIDTVSNARDLIDKLCSVCHASLYENDGKIQMIVDKKVDEVLFTINEDAHVLPDTLKIVALPSKELPNQINITYLNKDNNYTREPITVEDPKLSRSVGYGSLRKMDLDLRGISDESHAYLEGLHFIKSARYINYSISFKTALTGLPLQIGRVFRLESATLGFGTLDENGDYITNSGKRFRVSSIKRAENMEVEVTALEYYDEIYDIVAEDLVTYNVVRHTSLPNPYQKPLAVNDLILREENFRNASGDIVLNIVGYFNPPNTSAVLARNRIAFLRTSASAGATTLNLTNADEVRLFKVGDKISLNTELDLDSTPEYTITALYAEYNNSAIQISPALASNYASQAFLSKIEYAMNKYEYNKFGHALIDLYKDGVLIQKGLKSEDNSFKFINVGTGTYTCVVNSVSANGVVGDNTKKSISVAGKQLAPRKVASLSANTYKYNHVYKIAWAKSVESDLRNYVVTITPLFSSPEVPVLIKEINDALEYIHTFTVTGSYTISVAAVNTSGISSPATDVVVDAVLDIQDTLTPHYTIQGSSIHCSWNSVDIFNEVVKYEVYLNNEPFALTNPSLEFNAKTNPYNNLTLALRAWEGTSTQIPIANLPENGQPLSFDENYYIVVTAKYKYNGVEQIKQSKQMEIGSLTGNKPQIAWYSIVPEPVDNFIGQNHFKTFVVAIPDSSITKVSGKYYKIGTNPITIIFTKNNDNLWEYELTDLADGEYYLEIVGTGSNGSSNVLTRTIKIDTTVPDVLPRPTITKDNSYVQSMLISLSAKTSLPLNNSETIDVFNSKTVQITLAPFTTCANFAYIKFYIAEYDYTLKSYGVYKEYKIPQATGIPSNTLIANFKASITFAEDMPDFKIKAVQVKNSGIEGSLLLAYPSLRTKIDTTPPLIKINKIYYDGDTTETNYINNNYINGKVNIGDGLLLDISITELNSGLWSGAVNIPNLRMPIYYQLNSGDKKPLYQKGSSLFKTLFLIPKADFEAFNENDKVTITIYALDNALKVGTVVFTKIIDMTAPANVTNAKGIFGVEANKGVIKLVWENPTASDFSGVRIYDTDNKVLAEVVKNTSISILVTSADDKVFTLKAFDLAGNEADGIIITAKNYPPKAVVMLGATSDSGSVGLSWNAVTEDTNNDKMTDLDYYEISYKNPRTNTTITAKTKDILYNILMTKDDVTYFNSHTNSYITEIKVRAVDFFGGTSGTGAYSTPELQARPRFIESVDMDMNIFKFKASSNKSYTVTGASTIECVVDANYKNSEYITMSSIAQGDYLRVTMAPAYVAETKIKFVSTQAIAARFILHYKVVDPVTFEESDVYIQSPTHAIDAVAKTGTLDYNNFIEVLLTNSSEDSANTFVISLMKDNLSRESFFIKYVEVLFTGVPTELSISELQPRVRSIANEFYGESLLLSNMISIRSSKDTTNFMEIYKDGLGITYNNNKVTTIGKLSDGSYGAWFKDKVFIGGTSIANAPIRIDSDPSVSLGGLVANNSYSYISGTEGAFSSNGGLNTNCLKGNSTSATVGYNYNSKITANTSTTEVKQVGTYSWSQYTQEYLAFGSGTSYGAGLKAKFGNLGGLYGIWMTDGVYIGGTSYSNAEIKLQANDNTLYMGYYSSYSAYNLKITSSSIYLGLVNGSGWYNLAIYSSAIYLGINSSGYYETAISAGSVKLGSMNNGYYAAEFNSSLIGFGFTGYVGIYHVSLSANGFGAGLYTVNGSTAVYNTLLQASGFLTGCVDYVNGYYNTKITNGSIYLGHISGGTTYALTMYYGGTDESARYFSVKGANLADFLRIGKYTTTTSGYSYYALWSKQVMLSDSYTGTISDLASNTYLYIRRANLTRGLLIMGDGPSYSVPSIYIGAVECPCIIAVTINGNAIEGTSSSYFGVKGNSTSNYAVYGVSSSSNGVRGESSSSFGGYFSSSTSAGLYATTASNTYSAAYFYNSNSGPALTAYGSVWFTNMESSGTAGTPLHIDGSGKVFRYTGSSERYKNNITPRPYNKAILDLPVVDFIWKDSGFKGFGSWAERAHEIYPELVSYDALGRPDSVKYFEMPILLLQVCQEQQKEIDALKLALDELKKVVDKLLQ